MFAVKKQLLLDFNNSWQTCVVERKQSKAGTISHPPLTTVSTLPRKTLAQTQHLFTPRLYPTLLILVFLVLQGSVEALVSRVENDTIFRLPTFCETFLPNIIIIQKQLLDQKMPETLFL